MKKLITALAMFVANTVFANQIVLSSSAINVQLVDARYELVPTKTEVREIPGCNPNSEVGPNCYETVILESAEVIRVSISYVDTTFGTVDINPSYTFIDYSTSLFSAAEVQLLKSVYPQSNHGFSKIPAQFAKAKFSFNTAMEKKKIQVTDMKNSYICARNGETGDLLNPSCQDKIVYKTVFTDAIVATLLFK